MFVPVPVSTRDVCPPQGLGAWRQAADAETPPVPDDPASVVQDISWILGCMGPQAIDHLQLQDLLPLNVLGLFVHARVKVLAKLIFSSYLDCVLQMIAAVFICFLMQIFLHWVLIF